MRCKDIYTKLWVRHTTRRSKWASTLSRGSSASLSLRSASASSSLRRRDRGSGSARGKDAALKATPHIYRGFRLNPLFVPQRSLAGDLAFCDDAEHLLASIRGLAGHHCDPRASTSSFRRTLLSGVWGLTTMSFPVSGSNGPSGALSLHLSSRMPETRLSGSVTTMTWPVKRPGPGEPPSSNFAWETTAKSSLMACLHSLSSILAINPCGTTSPRRTSFRV